LYKTYFDRQRDTPRIAYRPFGPGSGRSALPQYKLNDASGARTSVLWPSLGRLRTGDRAPGYSAEDELYSQINQKLFLVKVKSIPELRGFPQISSFFS
jgi:hypothetical protein